MGRPAGPRCSVVATTTVSNGFGAAAAAASYFKHSQHLKPISVDPRTSSTMQRRGLGVILTLAVAWDPAAAISPELWTGAVTGSWAGSFADCRAACSAAISALTRACRARWA